MQKDNSFWKYLLKVYTVPDFVLKTRNTMVTVTNSLPVFMGFISQLGNQTENKNKTDT